MSKMRAVRLLCLASAALLALVLVISTAASRPATIKSKPIASTGAWTTYHHDNARTGYDSTLPLVQSVSTGWTSGAMDGQVYASPLVFNGIVYAATLNNTVYAFNQSTGATLWSKNLGAPQASGWICGNVSPMGILSTPVIDTAANRIYAATEIAGAIPTYHLFGLDLAASGNIVLNTDITPAGFDWTIQQQRGALALGSGYVYVPFGGRAGDCFHNGAPYFGYVVAAPTSGAAPIVFKTPSQAESVWSPGGVVIDDSTTNVFIPTGNAIPCSGSTMSDAIVKQTATLSLPTPTYFTPPDWQANWCGPDSDLGSASPVLISPGLMFMAGKRGGGFLLDPTNFTGVNNGQLFPARSGYAQAEVCLSDHSAATYGSFAYAAPYIYIECEGNGLVALSTNTSAPSFTPCSLSSCPAPNWRAGGTATFGAPIVAGGAVWAVDNGGGLSAFIAATGAPVFQSAGFGANRFATPAEAGGSVYVPSLTVIRSFNMNFACVGTPLSTSYLNWYDKASAGMLNDNIHVLNPGGTAANVTVSLPGATAQMLSVAPGAESYATFPQGTIGGPVTITSDQPVLASQRVQFQQTFNEVWAESATRAATSRDLNWYDKASAGMFNDNIHVLNPGGTAASVTVSLPGASSQMLSVAPGAEAYANFPQGTIGGPVTVTSTQPVLASQRVQFNQSFNEVWAESAAQAATTGHLNWYDKASAGMFNDNIHILNPGGAAASVTVSLPGSATQTLTVAGGAEAYVSFPQGSIGGPVTVSSTQPVLAAQRVQYYSTFNEIWAG